MGRRRKQYIDEEGVDTSSGAESGDEGGDFFRDRDGVVGDADLEAERELFSDPYSRKRKRRGEGKESAIYGVFGEDEEEERQRWSGKRTAKLHRCVARDVARSLEVALSYYGLHILGHRLLFHLPLLRRTH